MDIPLLKFTHDLPFNSEVIQGSYYIWPLVVLAYLLACLAAGTALTTLDRVINAEQKKIRYLWVVLGGISLGAGIWAMHFTAMEAFRTPFSVSYDISLTAISLLVSMCFCTLGLTAYSNRQTLRQTLISSLLITTGIIGMHYLGMSAMRMPATMYYDPRSILLAIGVAVLTSLLALLAAKHFVYQSSEPTFLKRALCSILMGVAIADTHFTAMYGMVFTVSDQPSVTTGLVEPSTGLNLAIAGVCAIIMLLGIIASESHRRLQLNTTHLKGVNALVSELEEARQQLEEVALRDSVTHLHNRHALNQELESIILEHKKLHSSFVLLFIDIDNFKRINDSLGHHCGDVLLVQVADRLHGCLREQDIIGRFGGDEFIIILKESQSSQINAIINRLLKAMEQPFIIEHQAITAGISIGAAFYPKHGRKSATLLRNADTALYQAKARGKHRAAVFNKQMHTMANRHLALEQALQKAIEQGEIDSLFLPTISTDTGKVSAIETLTRWSWQGENIICDDFTGLTENSALMTPLCQLILENALQMLKTLSMSGYDKIRLFIKLSPFQFQDPSFPEYLEAQLLEAGVSKQQLILTVTKKSIVENLDLSSRQLVRLKKLGVDIAMDGFGTGYSVVSHLNKLPINFMKLDQSLVKTLSSHPQDEVILEAILTMTHKLGLSMIAGGVETREQHDFFVRNHCSLLQGPLFSAPLSDSELVPFLQRDYCVPGNTHAELANAGLSH